MVVQATEDGLGFAASGDVVTQWQSRIEFRTDPGDSYQSQWRYDDQEEWLNLSPRGLGRVDFRLDGPLLEFRHDSDPAGSWYVVFNVCDPGNLCYDLIEPLPETGDDFCEFAAKATNEIRALFSDMGDTIEAGGAILTVFAGIVAVVLGATGVGIPLSVTLIGILLSVVSWGGSIADDVFNDEFWAEYQCSMYCQMVYLGHFFDNDEWHTWWTTYDAYHVWGDLPVAFEQLFSIIHQFALGFDKVNAMVAGSELEEWDCEVCDCESGIDAYLCVYFDFSSSEDG